MADVQMRERYVSSLVERIREDPYPSVAQMDLVESLMTPDETQAYAAILLEKMEGERFPSVPMMRRVQRLVGITG